jgi:DNA repair protein RadC
MQHIISEIEIIYKPNRFSKEILKTVGSVVDILRMFWNPNTLEYYEEFKVIYLDRGNHILGILTVSKGALNGVLVDVRVIFQGALKANAHSIIVSHNHPSGNAQPSQEDFAITKQIKAAGEVLNIKLLDHIILTYDNYLSFLSEGYL